MLTVSEYRVLSCVGKFLFFATHQENMMSLIIAATRHSTVSKSGSFVGYTPHALLPLSLALHVHGLKLTNTGKFVCSPETKYLPCIHPRVKESTHALDA